MQQIIEPSMDDKISMLQVRIDADCVDGESYDNINVA